MGKGTWSVADKDLNSTIETWDKIRLDIFSYTECYGAFFRRDGFKIKQLPFIFAFPYIPVWYMRIINKFNRKFKNIKYNVLAERDVYHAYAPYDGNLLFSEPGNVRRHLKQVLFTIKFNDDYSENGVYYLKYLLHHYLRLISIIENYLPIETEEHPKKQDSLSVVLALNNANPGYRSLVEGELTLQHFMLLDNINIVNSAFKDISLYKDYRQTWLFSLILLAGGVKFENTLKVGDKVSGLQNSKNSFISPDMTDAIVEEELPFNFSKIKVLAHNSYKVSISNSYKISNIYLQKKEKETS